jgi:hypothetical protein
MKLKHTILLLLSGWILIGTCPPLAAQSDQAPAPVVSQSPEQLQQLVAPIALNPDQLVAQILAAATYPPEVVEADGWLQQNPNLKEQALAQAVDKQPWDASIKALTQFPSVLANMDKNLSWTSSLGEAYVNQPQQVMDAVQTLRQRAQNAGNLKSTPQQTVKIEGQTIVIEPAQPDVVYVPAYDPWLVYGAALPVWPGWYPYPGLYLAGPGFGFGFGFNIGFFGGFGWGWHYWGADWHHHEVRFDHDRYISHSRTFINHNTFINRNRVVNRNTFVNHNSFNNHNVVNNRNAYTNHNSFSNHGGQSAFRGFNHGGLTMNHSFRGQSSFGGGFQGGGGFRGGSGGFHGGGRR